MCTYRRKTMMRVTSLVPLFPDMRPARIPASVSLLSERDQARVRTSIRYRQRMVGRV